MDELVNRRKPNASEAEVAVIGSMIMEPEAVRIASNILTKDDFFNKVYGTLFEAMVGLVDEGKSVDTVILVEKLKSIGAPSDIASEQYISSLLYQVPVSSRIREYAEYVKKASMLRYTIDVASEIQDECYAQNIEPAQVVETAQKKLMELISHSGDASLSDIKLITRNTLIEIDELSRKKGDVVGVPSGFHDLDFKIGGFQKSSLVLIAARPGMGKTAFALNIAQHAVLRANITTVVFSLEMSQSELYKRMLSSQSNVEAEKLKKGNLTDADWPRLLQAAHEYSHSNLYLEDEKNPTLSDIRRKCRKLKVEKNLGLVIIDYLQLMSEEGNSNGSRQEFIATVSRGLKNLARELEVPIIALSQLSRKVESREDKRPILSDLRESGSIEQDADIVMFLYRDDYYNKEASKKQGITTINIAKHRSGELGDIDLAWLPSYTKFANLDKTKMAESVKVQG